MLVKLIYDFRLFRARYRNEYCALAEDGAAVTFGAEAGGAAGGKHDVNGKLPVQRGGETRVPGPPCEAKAIVARQALDAKSKTDVKKLPPIVAITESAVII